MEAVTEFLKKTCILDRKLKSVKNDECKLCHKNVDKGEEVQ